MGSPSDDSDTVQRLLRLKHYEQPPPRYFEEFSGRVITRIERGEGRTSWWERFGFDLRPALGAATGVFACALVIYGVATADDAPSLGVGGVNSFGGSPLAMPLAADLMANTDSTLANSTNPVSTYGTPIDHNVFRAQLAPVSYQLK